MLTALNTLLCWQFLLFSLGIFFITWIIRTVIEFLIPKAINNKWWENLILPLLPCALGLLLASLAKAYPYPDNLAGLSSREIFGLVAGGLSTLIYKIAKGMLKQQVQAITGVVASQTTTTASTATTIAATTAPTGLMNGAPPNDGQV